MRKMQSRTLILAAEGKYHKSLGSDLPKKQIMPRFPRLRLDDSERATDLTNCRCLLSGIITISATIL